MIVTKNSMAVTHFYEEDNLLVSVYKGRVKVELVIEHLSKIIDFYQDNSGKQFRSVVDVSMVLGSFAKVFEFLDNKYYPIAVKCGLVCQAYVASDDLIIKNLSARLEIMASRFNIKSSVFNTLDEAKVWAKFQS